MNPGMRRAADGDGVLAAGDEVPAPIGLRKHHRQRPRPEARRQNAGFLGHARGPSVKRVDACDMHDERMRGGTLFDREGSQDRIAVVGIGCKPIDRLGRNGNEPAASEHVAGVRNRGFINRRIHRKGL